MQQNSRWHTTSGSSYAHPDKLHALAKAQRNISQGGLAKTGTSTTKKTNQPLNVTLNSKDLKGMKHTMDPAALEHDETFERQVDNLHNALRERVQTRSSFGSVHKQAQYLQSMFRRWDSVGDGKISRDEFRGAMAAENFVNVDKAIDALFDRIDDDENGFIIYTEFAHKLLGLTPNTLEPSVRRSLQQLREVIARRGGLNGMKELGNNFRIIDTNRNGSLSREELEIGMRRFGLEIADIDKIIGVFDKDDSGVISYNEFIRAIRGKMNKRREQLVLQAFDILDKDGSGFVDVTDVAGLYNTRSHPDVLNGRKSEEDVLREFLSQWDTIEKDGMVSAVEFIEYYQNISASIFNDDYFELMIRNAWHIPGGEGWCENTANLRVLVFDGKDYKVVCVENDRGLDPKNALEIQKRLEGQGTPGKYVPPGKATEMMNEGVTPGVTKRKAAASESKMDTSAAFVVDQKTTDLEAKIDKLHTSLKDRIRTRCPSGGPLRQMQFLQDVFRRWDTAQVGKLSRQQFVSVLQAELMGSWDPEVVEGLFDRLDSDDNGWLNYKEFSSQLFGSTPSTAEPDINAEMQAIRELIAKRGGNHGIRDVGVSFRIADTDRSGDLTKEEFGIALKRFGHEFKSVEFRDRFFRVFDKGNNGSINYNEFLRALRGKMNKRREQLVLQAFEILDKDGSGIVDITDIAGNYNTSKHPDVINGRKTKEDVLRDFLSQWDTIEKDDAVSALEFIEYYQDVSASIFNDDYFELMIRNAWHIPGGEGWCENTANLRVLVADGKDYKVVCIKNDRGLDPKNALEIQKRLEAQGTKGKYVPPGKATSMMNEDPDVVNAKAISAKAKVRMQKY